MEPKYRLKNIENIMLPYMKERKKLLFAVTAGLGNKYPAMRICPAALMT